MENNYQNLQCADDEKAMEYTKAIIKAVDMTHQVAAKSQMKSKKAREAIESKDKVVMWNTLQDVSIRSNDRNNSNYGNLQFGYHEEVPSGIEQFPFVTSTSGRFI